MRRKKKQYLIKKAVFLSIFSSFISLSAVSAEEEKSFGEDEKVQTDSTDVLVETEEESDRNVREVVVSATRTEMDVKDSPASIVIINRQQIEDRKANNLMDVLRDVPGVQFSRSGSVSSNGSVRIRGSESDHVLILIDGKRMSTDPSFYNTRELERIRMDDVERVEVVKGPASVLYGSSAMGGVINVITRKPVKDSAEVYLNHKRLEGYGALQTNIGTYIQAKKRGSFSWILSAARNYTNDLSFEENKQEYPSGSEIPVNFKGIWDINENNKIQLDFRYSQEKLSQEMYYKNPSYASMQTYYENDIRKLDYGLDYTGKSEKTNWQIRISRSEWKKDQDSYYWGTRNWKVFNITRSGADTIEGLISHSVSDKHLVTFGGEYVKEWIGSTQLGVGAETSKTYVRNGKSLVYGERERQNYSLYLQDEWTPSEKWLIIPAARIEHSDSFGTEFVPKIGATYFVKPDFRIKASAGKGYRIPTILELYRQNASGSMVGNPNLEPETSKSYEIGFEKDWEKHTARIAFYRSEVRDLIISKQVNPPVYTWANSEEALLAGVEIVTTHKLSKELDIRLGYNYLDAKDTVEDERLEGRPRHQFTFGATYRPLNSDWKFSLDGNLMTDYLYTDNFNKQHNTSYLIVNAIIDRKFGKEKKGSVYLGVENLFDKKEFDLSEYGRTYVMGVSYKF